jgi:hypothetical protein
VEDNMPAGVYERTEEIKQRQSKKMKEKIKEYNFSEINLKRKKTIEEKGIKIGRPETKVLQIKLCSVCDKEYSTKNDSKFCCKECYWKSRKGKPVCDSEILKNMDRSYQKNDDWSQWLKKDDLPEFKKYSGKVRRLSEKNYAMNADKINPNNYPRTICGVEGGYQLDHIKSLRQCFDENISIEQAASVDNLQLLPWKENLRKR